MCFSLQGGPWIPPLGRRDLLSEDRSSPLPCPWAGSAAAGSLGVKASDLHPPLCPTTPSRVDLASAQLFQQLLVKNNFFRARQLPPEPLCNPQAPDASPWWLGPQSWELQTRFSEGQRQPLTSDFGVSPTQTPGSLDGRDWKGASQLPWFEQPIAQRPKLRPRGEKDTQGHT